MKKNKEKFGRAVVVVVEMELYERLTINEAALGGGELHNISHTTNASGSAESDDVPRLARCCCSPAFYDVLYW